MGFFSKLILFIEKNLFKLKLIIEINIINTVSLWVVRVRCFMVSCDEFTR